MNTSERCRTFTAAIPADSNIRNKEHEKTEKDQGLKEQVEQMWKVKFKVVPVLIGRCCGLGCDPLGERLQQIPGGQSKEQLGLMTSLLQCLTHNKN